MSVKQKRLLVKTRAACMRACTKVANTTQMQAMTQSVHNGVIDAFGIRFGASTMIANEFTIAMLGLNAFRHFE
jgi:hypothetical protein